MQVSQDVPNNSNNSPIDLSNPADLVIYIILPIVAIVLYIIWRKRKKRRDDQ
ncbi:MAG: adenylosuccinate synthetase [Cytophagaceae bacterium]|nr:adenylosuccinate synthetase [Cytophagaceae bacterium]